MVYDSERPSKRRSKAASTLPSNQDLRDITGVDADQEADMERSAAENRQISPIAQNVLDQERAAATGANLYAGEASPEDTAPTSATSGARQSLNGLENSRLYRPAQADSNGLAGTAGDLVKGHIKRTRNLWFIGLISALVGSGMVIMLLGVLSGPLQFIHASRSFQEFHMSVQDVQTGIVAMKLARNIPHVINGEREKTRLGIVGNYFAEGIVQDMETRGFRSDFQSGEFKGYILDSKKIRLDDFPGLRGRSSEQLQDYFSRKYQVAARISGDNVVLPPTGRYFADMRLLYAVMDESRVNPIGTAKAHIMKGRYQFTLNPMRKWIQEKDNQILSNAERKLAWRKQQRSYIRNGISPPTATFASALDENGEPVNAEGSDDANDLVEEAREAQEALDEGDESKLNAFRDSLNAKLSVGGLAVVGILCFLQGIAAQYDIIVQNNIIAPMIRMAAQAMSWGAANEDGSPEYVDAEQNAYMADLYYDEEANTVWSDARSVQAEWNKPQVGPDIPEYAKANPEGNFVTRFMQDLNNATGGALDALCSPAAQVILIGAGVIVAGPIATAVSLVVGLASGPAIAMFADWIMNTFIANQVDPLAQGAIRGGFMNVGSMLLANEMGNAGGGVALSAAEGQQVKEQSQSVNLERFKEQSLAYRVFNPEDPRSFVAQVIDRQAPDPADNLTRSASGLLNFGSGFSSIVGRLLSHRVGAQDNEPYDYGRGIVAFLPSELNHPAMENLFDNADRVADILDANASANGMDNYIERAKTCFGTEIALTPQTDEETGEEYEAYAILPPTPGESPTEQTVRDPDNKCDEGRGTDHPWTRVRLFIKSMETMNAWGCVRADADDEVGQRACADIGNGANSGA